jgi:hypothetical protein
MIELFLGLTLFFYLKTWRTLQRGQTKSTCLINQLVINLLLTKGSNKCRTNPFQLQQTPLHAAKKTNKSFQLLKIRSCSLDYRKSKVNFPKWYKKTTKRWRKNRKSINKEYTIFKEKNSWKTKKNKV